MRPLHDERYGTKAGVRGPTPSLKKGDGVGYSGDKHQKGENVIAITDNRGAMQSFSVHDRHPTVPPEADTRMTSSQEEAPWSG